MNENRSTVHNRYNILCGLPLAESSTTHVPVLALWWCILGNLTLGMGLLKSKSSSMGFSSFFRSNFFFFSSAGGTAAGVSADMVNTREENDRIENGRHKARNAKTMDPGSSCFLGVGLGVALDSRAMSRRTRKTSVFLHHVDKYLYFLNQTECPMAMSIRDFKKLPTTYLKS